jgi:hypothetical protein
MAGSTFIIQEVIPEGSIPPQGGAARFEWNARNKNIPTRPWSFGVKQRSVRTDYPGADDPTEQVLGPNYEEFTLRGRWDDRYNPQGSFDPNNAFDRGILNNPSVFAAKFVTSGYAVLEWKKFEAMVRRGNVVRIIFEEVTVQGLITSCEFDYRRSWDIGYSFTMSPHHRQPKGQFALKRSPRTALNSRQLLSEVTAEVDDIVNLHADSPQHRLTGQLFVGVDLLVDSLVTGLTAIDDAIDQRNLTLSTEPDGGLLKLAALFLSQATTAANVIELLRATDSSEGLDFESGIGVLDFDVWSKGLMESARRLVISAQRAASDLSQRATPNAIRLYRPQKGESLYAVSNRFYRTPHNWRTIARRNGLDSFTLTGEELLIIPEVTGR